MSVSNPAVSSPNTVSTSEIVFIDGALPDIDQLLAAVKPGAEAVILDAGQDGLLQIARALAGKSGIDAIHVLSHGSAGALELGSAHVRQDSLAGYGDALGAIRAALADGADLLLYGCEVAQGAAGRSFIEALAAATGADVAASTDLTGSALLGGDWTLETTVGQVETPSLGWEAALAAYGAVLGPMPSVTTIDFSTDDGELLGPVVTDGQFGSTDIDGVVIDLYGGDASGNATNSPLFFSTLFDGVVGNTRGGDPTMVIMERSGKEFAFKGIKLDDYMSELHVIQFEGFKDNASTGTATVTMVNEVRVVTEADLPSSMFGDVDKVVFKVVSNTGNGNMWMTYNNIVIDKLTAAPSDTTRPTVASIERVTSLTGVTNADELVFKLTFSEDVQGVDATKFTVSGPTGSTVTVTAVDGSTYTVKVSGGNLASYNGAVTLGFAANQDIADNSANPLDLSVTPATNETTYQLDNTAPTVTSIVRNAAATSAESLTWTVTFSESVTNIGPGDFSVSGTTATVTGVTGSGTTYQVTVSGGDLDNLNGNVTLGFAGGQDIADGAGNALAATTPTGTSQPTYTVDNSAPTLSSAAVNGTSLVLTYSEALDNVALMAGSFTVNVGGTLVGITNVALDAAIGRVTLTLATAVQPNQSVTVSYADVSGGSTPIQDTAGNDAANLNNQVVANNSLDTLAPTLVAASVNGISLVLTYNEALDNVALMAGSFSVNVGGMQVGITNVALDAAGGKVTLTLATAVQPNQSVKISYADVSGGSTPIQDKAGNDAATVTNVTVTNNTLDTLAPTLVSAAVNGNTLVLTYDEALNETYKPNANAFSVKIDNQAVDVGNAVVDGPNKTITLTLDQAAQPGAIVKVSYTELSNAEAIQDGAGNQAANLTDHAVSNASGDTQAPTLSSAVVTGAALVLTYDEALNEEYKPNANAFSVKIDNQVVIVTNAVVDGPNKTITLTLDQVAQPGAIVKVSYNELSNAEAIQDGAGNQAASLTDHAVSNASVDTQAPTLSSAVVTGAALVLTYDEALNEEYKPNANAFSVKIDNQVVTVTSAVVDGPNKTITLTLDQAAQPGAIVKVSYTELSNAEAIQDGVGNQAGHLTDHAVSNESGDTLAPTLSSAVVTGASLVLTWSETLDAAHPPAASAFAVKAGNAAVAVSAVAVDAVNKTVTLTLASSVQNGQSVTVSYTDPTGGNDPNAIQDAAGNDAASLADRTVTNNTPAVVTPPVVVTPPSNEKTVDGVKVVTQQVRNLDGSTSTKLTIPVVTSSRNEQVGNNTVADIPLAQKASGGNVLLAQLPVGFGMTTIGSGIKTAGDSLTDLIREIKAHTTTGSAEQSQLTGGGSGFVGELASSTQLLVQTIVPTYSGATAPDQPLAIVGQPAAIGNPLTALVLDASGLPANTHITLDNVEFAALIGAVNVSGGAGAQKVWGDSASQTIFLGADDDVLHGGGGDDIVGSAGGNDRIYGDEGNDIVFGGEGNDTIDGGTGTDTIRLMGASRAEYTMRIKDGAVVMTHLKPDADGVDTVVSVERLQYAGQAGTVDFNDSEIAGLVRLYSTAFGRNADTGGINFWIEAHEKGYSMMEIAHFFIASDEAKTNFGALSDRDFVTELYDVAMHRVASEGEVGFWTGHLQSGALDRGEVLYHFATSDEKVDLVGVVNTSIMTS